jgi:hypothetical protein
MRILYGISSLYPPWITSLKCLSSGPAGRQAHLLSKNLLRLPHAKISNR